jgi:GntR family transcriptional regulator
MNGAFAISQSDKRPMYFQIMDQIKQRIALRDWAEGQPIPSIRQLAADLQVSVTHQGKGSRVASTPGLAARLREQELREHLEQATRIALQLGIEPRQLEERLREAGDRIAEKETI